MRILAIVKRIVIQTLRDKRTLALIMLVPLLILSLVNFLFDSSSSSDLRVGVYNTAATFNSQLKSSDIHILKYTDNENIKNKIKNDDLKAFINLTDGKLEITYENSTPSDSTKIKAKVQAALLKTQLSANPLSLKNTVSIKNSYIYGDENLSFFDTLSPILIGFFVFFFVFLISGISLLKERTSKTLEKLLATPINRREIIWGYLIGYGLFAVVQTIIIVLFSIYVLDIWMNGNILLLLLTNIIIAFVALSLGILLSTFANSEFQMMQFIPIVIVPQILFTGMIPVENMANWLQKLAHLMPLYYGAQALQNIMVKNYNFAEIQFNLLILLLFGIVFTVLNILGLKRYRKI